jgi:hypothetical protein
MRCYHLNNSYLAGIHAGIQSAHSETELALVYALEPELSFEHHSNPEFAFANYKDWAKNHKTIIVLDGGWHSELVKMTEFLMSNKDHPYAWASFCESPEALNGAMTNLSIVLPFHMYEFNRDLSDFLRTRESQAVVVRWDNSQIAMTLHQDGTATILHTQVNQAPQCYSYNAFELELIKRLSRLKLM